MVHATVVVCESEPLVPVTVTVYEPAAAVPGESVSVELPLLETAVGFSVAEAPAGTPLAASETEPLKPFAGVTEMVEVPLPETLAGLADSEKSGEAEPLQLVPKQIDSTAWSSIPLGATPVCPCRISKKPAPVIVTGTFAVWKLVVAVYFASKALRELLICVAQPPPLKQPG
jgi:hypothetical protein